jgi:hypothetical protein
MAHECLVQIFLQLCCEECPSLQVYCFVEKDRFVSVYAALLHMCHFISRIIYIFLDRKKHLAPLMLE